MIEWPRPMSALTLGSTRSACPERRAQRDERVAAGGSVLYECGSPVTRVRPQTRRQTEHGSGETRQARLRA